jgi:hypothetical protein
MSDEFNAGKYGAIVAVEYAVANAVTNKTNEDVVLAGGVNSLWVAPKGGSVVGISAQASAEVTAGSVTFRAQKDGTEFAQSGYPAPVLDDGTSGATQQTYASIRPGVLTFSAGEGIGVSYTSTTDAAPTDSNDYNVFVFMQLDPN